MLNLRVEPHPEGPDVVQVVLDNLAVAVRPHRVSIKEYAPMIAAALSVSNSPGMPRGSVSDWWIEDARRRSEIAKQLTPVIVDALTAYAFGTPVVDSA